MFSTAELYLDDIETIVNSNIKWDMLQDKSILITGASGMIGTLMVDVFMWMNDHRNLNLKVYACGRNKAVAQERFSGWWGHDNFSFISLDVNKPIMLYRQIDYLIHAASNTHPLAYAEDPIGSIMTNIQGTYNLLEYARLNRIKRCAFLSSVEIYGKAWKDDDEFTEDYCGYIDCNTLRAGYPEGKRAGEALCQAFIEKYGLDIVIPRLSRVFGPTMKNNDSKAMAQFIRNAVDEKPIVLKSEGRQIFSYVYTVDAVIGILTVLFNGNCGDAYNIASDDKKLSLRNIAEIIATINNTQVKFEKADNMEKKGYSKAINAILNTDKLKALSWIPLFSVEDSVARTVRILQECKNA